MNTMIFQMMIEIHCFLHEIIEHSLKQEDEESAETLLEADQ